MMHTRRLLIVLTFALALTLPAAAADEPTAAPVQATAPAAQAEPQFVPGAGTTILLLGIGAVVAVVGIVLLRENAQAE